MRPLICDKLVRESIVGDFRRRKSCKRACSTEKLHTVLAPLFERLPRFVRYECDLSIRGFHWRFFGTAL